MIWMFCSINIIKWRYQEKNTIVSCSIPIAKAIPKKLFFFFILANLTSTFPSESCPKSKRAPTPYNTQVQRPAGNRCRGRATLAREHLSAHPVCPAHAALAPFWFPLISPLGPAQLLAFPFLTSQPFPFPAGDSHKLWLKTHGRLAALPSGSRLLIYLLLKERIKQPNPIPNLWKIDLNGTFSGIWGCLGKVGEGGDQTGWLAY